MATLLKHEDFAGGAYDTGYWTAGETAFAAAHYTPDTAEPKYVSSSPSPGASGQSIHYYIKSGTNEVTPVRLQKNGVLNEFYIEWYVYFKSAFTYPGGLKLFRAGYTEGGGNSLFLEYNYEGFIVFYTYDAPSGLEHYNGSDDYTFSEDTAIKIAIYHKNSTPSTADGRSIFYVNDTIIKDSGSVITRTSSADKDFFWIGGNHSWGGGNGEGGGTTAGADSHLYFSNIKVYDGIPSAGASSKVVLKKASAGQRAGQQSGQF